MDANSQYCTPNVTGTTGSGLLNVTLNELNNTSLADEGYQNYTLSDTATLVRGTIDSITVETAASGWIILWIDFNNDMVFQTGERFVLGFRGAAGIYSFPFTIPVSATLGYTRMRVWGSPFSSWDPCSVVISNGDLEDYVVNIITLPMKHIMNTAVQENICCAIPGKTNRQIIKLKVLTNYSLNPLSLTEFNFNSNGTSNLSDITSAKVWYTGNVDYFSTGLATLFGSVVPGASFTISGNQLLSPDTNYFWLTYDISATAVPSNFLDAELVSLKVDSSGNILTKNPIMGAPSGNCAIQAQATGRVSFPETYIWYYGAGVGIDFNCTPPKLLRDGVIFPSEGSTAISDKNTGNLLFYTNGNIVYNAEHKIMPNGMGLKGHTSSLQSAIIIPKPSSDSLYYIFTSDAGPYASPPNDGVHYSVVDMSLNGGLGDVIEKNTFLFSEATEMLDAVHHCNGKDIWVAGHAWPNSNDFYLYLVSDAGVSAPIISSVGTAITNLNGSFSNIGMMKFSPDGKKLALETLGDEFVEIFDFDNSTGTLCNPVKIFSGEKPKGISFSPDNSKFYITNEFMLFQYDIFAGDSAAIVASKNTIYDNSAFLNASMRTMQLAPDGRIYIEGGVNHDPEYMRVIENPNLLGAASNYNHFGFYLQDRRLNLDAIAFVESYFLDVNYFPRTLNAAFTNNIFCLDDTTFFNNTSVYYSGCPTWDWDFDDPVSGSENTSNLQNPKHLFTSSGLYNVRLILNEQCQTDTFYKEILVLGDTSYSLPDTGLCMGDSIQIGVDSSSGITYIWSPSTDLNDSTLSNPTTSTSTNVNYTLIASNGICADTLNVNVDVSIPLTFFSQQDTMICKSASVQLNAVTGAIGNASFNWSPANDLDNFNIANPVATPVQTITYIVTINNAYCPENSDSITIFVENIPQINLVSDTIICSEDGDQVRLNVSNTGYAISYEWSNADTTPSITITEEGIYWVSVKSAICNVSIIDSIKVTDQCPLIYIPNAFSPNGDGENDIFRIRADGISNIVIKIFDRWGKKVHDSVDPNLGWDGLVNGMPNAKSANEGVYVYIITGTFVDGTLINLKGNLTLIK